MPSKENEQSFLQSPAWETFQQAVGLVTNRFGGVLVIRRPLPFGKSWVYIPRWEKHQIFNHRSQTFGDIIQWAKQQSAVFIRSEPVDVVPEGHWRDARSHVQPQQTLILNLAKSEEELLADMHPKTRYNIRLAQRKGVTVRFSQVEQDLEEFLNITRDVSARGAFHFHSNEYYRKMLAVLGVPLDEGGARGIFDIAIAEHGGTPLAVHLLLSYGDTVTYAHGASASSQRELMAPHLLHWESIKRAKKQGFKKYDFYGISPPDFAQDSYVKPANHPWAGITRFKLGFGGEQVSYPGTFDYVLEPLWYWLYNMRRRL
jgi:peptidoglycan pentaglycine glycine transferase (the first glycine)